MAWRIKNNHKRHRSLRSELLLILSVTSLVTMLLVGVILSFILFRQSYKQAEEDLRFYMDSVQNQFANHISFIEESIIYIRNNPEWRDFFLGKDKDVEHLEKSLQKGVNLFSDSNIAQGVHPIVKDLYVFNMWQGSVESHFYPVLDADRIAAQKRLRRMVHEFAQDHRFHYFVVGSSIEMYITLYDDDLQPKGYCVAILSTESIHQIFRKLEKYQDYSWGILDEHQTRIAGSEIEPDSIAQAGNADKTIRIDHKDYMLNSRQGSFGLTGYILVPKSNLYRDIEPSFKLGWMIAISLFFVELAVIIYVSKLMTSPLSTIVQKMKQVGKGDFDTRLDDYKIWEFQEISQSFNEMIAKIEHLIKEVYEAEILAKEARIRYLQAQINPHFMFNVLAMVAIRIKKHKDEDLYRLVTSFAGLMQGKLFRKNEIEIPLADEIEIAEFYLYLSGERFKGRVSYEITWQSEDLKECMIPRLCIEPLVENAMIHGLEPKSSQGTIKVHIAQEENRVLSILVEDDGVGFDLQNMPNSEERSSPRTGIMNIQRLIYNLYGEPYGLTVDSKPGVGTKIQLRLPYSKERRI